MRKYRVSFEDGARKDILGIIDYIEHALLNPPAAAKIAARIYRKCLSLAVMPGANSVRYVGGSGKELRFAYVRRYVIVYYIDEANTTVHIRAVINANRDILAMLREGD